jgi:hypothetical protein
MDAMTVAPSLAVPTAPLPEPLASPERDPVALPEPAYRADLEAPAAPGKVVVSVTVTPRLEPRQEKRGPAWPPGATFGVEPLSPFVSWEAEERVPMSGDLLESDGQKSLVVALLREPSQVVERLLDPSQAQSLVLGSLAAVAVGTGFFSVIGAFARGAESPAWSAALMVFDVLLAMGAALGPIYATGLVLSARLPLARLVSVLLSSAATGSLLLAGLAPPMFVLWRMDSNWWGPLALLSAFALGGAAGGFRAYQVLFGLAEAMVRASRRDAAAVLTPDDVYRVGILARVALMLVAFTTALAAFAFNTLY